MIMSFCTNDESTGEHIFKRAKTVSSISTTNVIDGSSSSTAIRALTVVLHHIMTLNIGWTIDTLKIRGNELKQKLLLANKLPTRSFDIETEIRSCYKQIEAFNVKHAIQQLFKNTRGSRECSIDVFRRFSQDLFDNHYNILSLAIQYHIIEHLSNVHDALTGMSTDVSTLIALLEKRWQQKQSLVVYQLSTFVNWQSRMDIVHLTCCLMSSLPHLIDMKRQKVSNSYFREDCIEIVDEQWISRETCGEVLSGRRYYLENMTEDLMTLRGLKVLNSLTSQCKADGALLNQKQLSELAKVYHSKIACMVLDKRSWLVVWVTNGYGSESTKDIIDKRQIEVRLYRDVWADMCDSRSILNSPHGQPEIYLYGRISGFYASINHCIKERWLLRFISNPIAQTRHYNDQIEATYKMIDFAYQTLLMVRQYNKHCVDHPQFEVLHTMQSALIDSRLHALQTINNCIKESECHDTINSLIERSFAFFGDSSLQAYYRCKDRTTALETSLARYNESGIWETVSPDSVGGLGFRIVPKRCNQPFKWFYSLSTESLDHLNTEIVTVLTQQARHISDWVEREVSPNNIMVDNSKLNGFWTPPTHTRSEMADRAQIALNTSVSWVHSITSALRNDSTMSMAGRERLVQSMSEIALIGLLFSECHYIVSHKLHTIVIVPQQISHTRNPGTADIFQQVNCYLHYMYEKWAKMNTERVQALNEPDRDTWSEYESMHNRIKLLLMICLLTLRQQCPPYTIEWTPLAFIETALISGRSDPDTTESYAGEAFVKALPSISKVCRMYTPHGDEFEDCCCCWLSSLCELYLLRQQQSYNVVTHGEELFTLISTTLKSIQDDATSFRKAVEKKVSIKDQLSPGALKLIENMGNDKIRLNQMIKNIAIML